MRVPELMTALLLGAALGLDSFRASMALGVRRLAVSQQIRLALAFALCDGVAPLLGLSVGPTFARLLSDWSGLLGRVLLAGYGLHELVAPRETRDDAPSRGGWVALGIPIFLSLDNLLAGLGLGLSGLPIVSTAAVLGTVSGLMAVAGLNCGALLGRTLPVRAERLSGAALIFLSLILLLDKN